MSGGTAGSFRFRRTLTGLLAVLVLSSGLIVDAGPAAAIGVRIGEATTSQRTTGSLSVFADGSSLRPCCTDKGSTFVSDDGRYVTYSAKAETGTSSAWGSAVLQFDGVTGVTTTIAAADDGSVSIYDVTADGRYVVVLSSASTLLPGVVGAAYNVYRWDRGTRMLSAVSGTPLPSQLSARSFPESMSPDGRFVVFNSTLPDTVPDVDDSIENLYIWDGATRTTTAIAAGNGAGAGSLETLDGRYVGAPVSDDGRYVTFVAWSTSNGSDGTREVYQWDRSTGDSTRITTWRLSPTLTSASRDGRYVTFSSRSPGTFDVSRDLYQWDRISGLTTVVSDGVGDQNPVHVSQSGDAVILSAQHMLPGDTGDLYRPYAWSRGSQTLNHLLPSNDMAAQDWSDDASAVVYLRPNGELGLWNRNTETTDVIVGGQYSEDFQDRSIEFSTDQQKVTWVSSRRDGSAGPLAGVSTARQWDSASRKTILLAAPDANLSVKGASRSGEAMVFSSEASNLGGMPAAGPRVYLWRRDVAPVFPNAPWPSHAVPANAQVTLDWTPPVPNEGGPITGYRIFVDGDTADTPQVEVGPGATSAVITGLTNETTYRFRIEARNADGYGVRSGPSEAATPHLPPSAPTITTAAAGNGFVDLTWTPPDAVGAPALTNYLVATYVRGAPQGEPFWTGGTSTSARISRLDNSVSYQFSVRARSTAAIGPESPLTAELTPMPPGPVFVPLQPCRLLDTRYRSDDQLRPGAPRDVRVTGQRDCVIPQEALAVEATITAVDPAGAGYLRAWPRNPRTSSGTFLNYAPSSSTSNTGTVGINSDGNLSLQVFGSATQAVVDAQGYYLDPTGPSTGSAFVAVAPCRVYDSRRPGAERFARNETRKLLIAGQPSCDVPQGAVAIEATITAVSPASKGFLRAGPTGTPEPAATFLTFAAGRSTTNTGTIAIHGEGDANLTLTNHAAATDYVIDVQGWFLPVEAYREAPGAVFEPLQPCRLLDTRAAPPKPVANSLNQIRVIGAGTCGIPDNALAVEATITAVSPATTGFLQVGPSGTQVPVGTFLNYTAGRSTTNTGTIALGTDGSNIGGLAIRNHGGTLDYVIDVQGYFSPA